MENRKIALTCPPATDGSHNANQVLSIPSSTQSRYKGVSVMMEGISISKITS